MSFLASSFGQQNYEFAPRTDLPVLILSNSLGTDLTMWGSQAQPFGERFSLLRYDSRGQGGSSSPTGPYSIEQMGLDVLSMMDALAIPSAHFCGLSMGGMVGQWLGIHAPQRLRSLVLSNTAAKIGSLEGWNDRIHVVQVEGLAPIVPSVLERWFSPAYRSADSTAVETTRQMLLHNDPVGYVGGCAAVRDADFRNDIHRIQTPTLVIAGALDPVTTPADADFLASRIPNSAIALLEAAHLSNTEATDAFNAAVLQFCQTIEEGLSSHGR